MTAYRASESVWGVMVWRRGRPSLVRVNGVRRLFKTKELANKLVNRLRRFRHIGVHAVRLEVTYEAGDLPGPDLV
jgi:hypothetical protein